MPEINVDPSHHRLPVCLCICTNAHDHKHANPQTTYTIYMLYTHLKNDIKVLKILNNSLTFMFDVGTKEMYQKKHPPVTMELESKMIGELSFVTKK